MTKKYYDLYNSVKETILCGEYKAGSKIPSKRVMADKSGYSLITVEKAYDMLVDEGYIESRERSGYYVCKLDMPLCKCKTISNPKMQIQHIDETVKSVDSTDFEYSLWLKTVRHVMSEKYDKLFVKSPGKGIAELRNSIADYLFRYRGMIANPRNIIIGSGAEQLYESVVKVLGRDKIYGIENPSYEKIKAVYRGLGTSVCELDMGKDGIEKSELLSKHFDVLHVTPFHSYPSGITTSLSKRCEYLNFAKSTDSYIIEDDYDSEFFVPGQPIQSLYSLDSNKCVIYINTFSKSLSPSMRMGYMILPDSLMESYDKNLGMFSCSVPVLDQYVLSEFISSGNFERHLNRVRRKMKK